MNQDDRNFENHFKWGRPFTQRYKVKNPPEGRFEPPTWWTCACGRDFIGDVRLFAHLGPGHEVASNHRHMKRKKKEEQK